MLVFRRSEILLLPAGATLKISPKKLGLLRGFGRFPSAPWAWLANKCWKFVHLNKMKAAVLGSPGEVFPTPAGVMAKLVANK